METRASRDVLLVPGGRSAAACTEAPVGECWRFPEPALKQREQQTKRLREESGTFKHTDMHSPSGMGELCGTGYSLVNVTRMRKLQSNSGVHTIRLRLAVISI